MCSSLNYAADKNGEAFVIARIWKGITRQQDRDSYLEYLNKTGLPDYHSTQGNGGVFVLCRVFDGKAEFTLISLWDSWDSIKKFAGPEYDKAVYYPEAANFCWNLNRT
jgi:heme-degrading monooxygenase HmoA